MKLHVHMKRLLITLIITAFVILPVQSNDFSFVATATDEMGKTDLTDEYLQEEQGLLEVEIDALIEEIGLDELSEDATLEEKLDAILADERLDGTITGVSIRNASTGEVLYDQFADIRLHPASNMKILTGAAALEILGPDYTYTTEVLTDGDHKGAVLQGNLYIKGKGDPTLLKEDFVQFAKDLKEQGIKNIKGDLIGDDTWYDDVHLSGGITWGDEQYYYGSSVSALTISPNEDYDTGTVIVDVDPGKSVGKEAVVSVYPENSVVEIVNKTTTVASNESSTVTMNREHGSNVIVVEGNVPSESATYRQWRSVFDPTELAISVFEEALKEEGIKLIGNGKVKKGTTPDNATVLTSKESMPLQEILIPFMKLSNNGHGEMFTKEMGKVVHGEGSWSKGLQVITSVIGDYGANTDTINLRDGSGMSHQTHIPAEEISQILYGIQDASWFSYLEESLPVAGIDERFVGGTLRYRMLDESTKGNVKAKTGSLTGVSTLSGYVTAADGEELIFSIMMNNFISGSMTQIQDVIATVLAEHEF